MLATTAIFLSLCVIDVVAPSPPPDPASRLFTCLKCTGLRNCDICRGRFCYKMVAQDDDGSPLIKRGCLNGTDALSRVGECSDRNERTGGSMIEETICICADKDRCNSAGASSLFASFFLLVVFLL